MKKLMRLLLVLTTASWGAAQQAPFATQDVPISSHDRVYSADQTSNTLSVIDPANNRLLGVIRLGDQVPTSLSPLYRGSLMVHGLAYSPDGKTLAVVFIGSNAVSLIDTSTNNIEGMVYVGRAPHEAFLTPDGREIWATVWRSHPHRDAEDESRRGCGGANDRAAEVCCPSRHGAGPHALPGGHDRWITGTSHG
jgi:YVTN family beta-propeller protein